MTVDYGCSDASGPKVDAVGNVGCGGVGSGAASWIRGSKSGGGGGDGVGEWLGVIGLVEMWSSGGLLVWGGNSKSEKSWLIS